MPETKIGKSYRFYWGIWGILLLVTLIMIFIDRPAARALSGEAAGAPGFLIFVLVAAMLLKAVLIAAYFMHLRFERLSLVLIVAISLLATAALLYGLVAVEGASVMRLSGG